jgi:hypothetical protein
MNLVDRYNKRRKQKLQPVSIKELFGFTAHHSDTIAKLDLRIPPGFTHAHASSYAALSNAEMILSMHSNASLIKPQDQCNLTCNYYYEKRR